MRIYETRDINPATSPTCSYCRNPGHNISTCPQVKKDWYIWRTHVVPMQSDVLNTVSYYRNPKYWGEWYLKCEKGMQQQHALIERQKAKAASSRDKQPRKATKCGFCREEGHNRSQCHKMHSFLQVCYTANEKWRAHAFHLLSKLGLAVGSVVQVSKPTNYYDSNSDRLYKTAIISDINWDSLNVAAAYKWNWDHEWLKQSLKITAIIDGKKINIGELSKRASDGSWKTIGNITKDKQVIADIDSNYSSWQYEKTLSSIKQELSTEWTKDYKEAFQYLAKKKTLEKLQDTGFIDLVKKWSSI